MNKIALVFPLFFAACCPPPLSPQPDGGDVGVESDAGTPCADLRCVIEALPVCDPGVEMHDVEVSATFCTLKSCGNAECCNRCGWRSATDLSPLHLPDSPYECEVNAWNAVLSEYAFDASITCRSEH